MSLNELDLTNVEEPKDFGAVKATQTRLRIRAIEEKPSRNPDKYKTYIEVQNDFVDASAVEPVDAKTTASAPIVNLYTHNDGCLKGLRRFVEAHGYTWADFVGSSDRIGFLKGMAGAEADVKIKLKTHNEETGEELDNPRNEVRYLISKKAA